VTRGKIAGVPVDISRTGYTGDLGFEVWMPWRDAIKVWDALITKGKAFDIHPAGDDRAGHRADRGGADSDRSRLHFEQESADRVAEVFAGGNWAGEACGLEERNFCGARGAGAGSEKGATRALVGLEINWNEVEALYDKLKMAPQVPSMASRVAVPVYRNGRQVARRHQQRGRQP